MNRILEYVSSLTSLLLPSICFVVGLILMLIGLAIFHQPNDLGSMIFLVGITLLLSAFILPFYFLIKGLMTSIKDLSSKEKILRFSGLIGISLAILFIISLVNSGKQFFDIIKFVPLEVIVGLALIFVVLLLFLYVIYIFVKKILRFLYKMLLKGEKK